MAGLLRGWILGADIHNLKQGGWKDWNAGCVSPSKTAKKLCALFAMLGTACALSAFPIGGDSASCLVPPGHEFA
jgi:hypothetical protein